MFEVVKKFPEYLKKLKKNELTSVIEDYNNLSFFFNCDKLEIAKKKDDLIKSINENKENYIKMLIMTIDKDGAEALKKNNEEDLETEKHLLDYLVSKKVLWQGESYKMPEDLYSAFLKFYKDKEIVKDLKEREKLYKMATGIITAYGVVDKQTFIDALEKSHVPNALDILNVYYKKDYLITDDLVRSEKLTNEKRINKYYKNQNYRQMKPKEFLALGENTYHHTIKSYKKFIKTLKNYYVFKNKDIKFVDENIVIPYLYTSINEEKVAQKGLEETVAKLFEFKDEKLKNKMIQEIIKIRKDFPLWEYRGYTKGDEKDEK